MVATILSLGAGVQSTTMLLMADRGLITRPDAAVFADTQWEPASVYTHLDWLKKQVSIPVHVVTAGDIRQDALDGNPRAWMPVFVYGEGGKKSMLRRQCTSNYKLTPIRREARRIMESIGAKTVTMQIGISLDEAATRMRDSGVQYVTNVYPLVDLGMTRDDCLSWMRSEGYPEPKKSSCIGCPMHDDAHWAEMKSSSPDDFQDAVRFEQELSEASKRFDYLYLHYHRTPLDQIDFSKRMVTEGFTQECLGMCGI